MENAKPPIKILSPGKVFRSDDDATHSPMFSQMEGLVVDKNISLCDLQGMLDIFSARIFGEGVKTRLRPSYFPFTEPSVEVDVSCFACGGKGCKHFLLSGLRRSAASAAPYPAPHPAPTIYFPGINW